MAKGKKFDAAEKHFLKKQQQYEQDIKALRNHNLALARKNTQLMVDNDILSDQVIRISKENDELRRLLNMTPEERARAVAAGEIVGMVKALRGGLLFG